VSRESFRGDAAWNPDAEIVLLPRRRMEATLRTSIRIGRVG
jgi:hypothetical protein